MPGQVLQYVLNALSTAVVHLGEIQFCHVVVTFLIPWIMYYEGAQRQIRDLLLVLLLDRVL